jgi:phage shock protein PspC (stress-responsive transcriptional regulator)
VPVLQRDDQITFVVNAMRMLHGEMIYLDFYQYTPPGTDLVYLGLFKAFGVHAWIASAVVVLLGMAALFVCYAIAAQVMPRTSRTACPERNRRGFSPAAKGRQSRGL